MLKKLFLCCLLFVSFNLLLAHDYWLQAEKFILQKGEWLNLHLWVGDDLNPDEERELQKKKTLSFQLHSLKGSEDLLKILPDSNFPLLKKQLDFEGLALITMERNFSFLTLLDEKFHQYLIHEFLIDAMDTREKIGKRKEEKERYARAIKSLIKVGNKNPKDNQLYSKIFGHTIEIILLQNPYEMKKGDLLEAKLFYKGKALTKKVIMALHKEPDGKFTELITYTDEEGIARFKLNYKGMWVIRATHLYPCENCPDVDWESYWTSFSFELP